MKYLVNSREMKQYDRNTTEHFGIPGLVLMERAAAAFVDELHARRVDLTRVLIVCGTGNNGGDGLAIGRMLSLAGSCVDIVLAGSREHASEQNVKQQEILSAYGFELLSEIPDKAGYTTVIDALFGVGLSRNVEGNYAALIDRLNALKGWKAAVDIPSGISSDSGAVLGVSFRADLTVTFAYIKTGMALWPGNEYTGAVAVKDIGITDRSFLGMMPQATAYELSDLTLLPERRRHSNKGTYGKLLVAAGSVNMAGAAYLCAKAAYASGCGLVRILTPEENRTILQGLIPEAVLTTYRTDELARGITGCQENSVSAALTGRRHTNTADQSVIEAINWADAVVCGPGIGTSKAAEQLLELVISHALVPVLLDADALNLTAKNKNLLKKLPAHTVVTPHLGEMSRLTGVSVPEIQSRLMACAEEFSKNWGAVCVLKDEHTVTAVPNGRIYLNMSGNPGLATAGSGDVLSGVIGSLIAQGMEEAQAAPLGVYLHGLAGDRMAEQTGMAGMMASDLPEGIRLVLKDI